MHSANRCEQSPYRIAQALERQLALAAPVPEIRDGHRAMLKVPVRGLVAGADRRVRAGARESDTRSGERRMQRRHVADDGRGDAQRVDVAAAVCLWR